MNDRVDSAKGAPDLATIPEQHWDIARSRFEVIRPLLEQSAFNIAAVEERARACQLHRTTVYRWLAAYRRASGLHSLLPQSRGPARGMRRLSSKIEEIIEGSLENRYLSRQRLSAVHIVRDIELRCRDNGVDTPSESTVRRRIMQIPKVTAVHRREGARAAHAIAPIRGSFPETVRPLGVVQIDHTPLDLILVDDVHRRPIGKAWLTLAVDVFSRMVAGFSLAFEPPSSLSVGLCLAHAILPKDAWLTKHGLSTPWPVHGLMDVVHCDNGREFHGQMLRKACEQYGIELRFRPVKRPWYGGHIERLLGTFAKEVHSLAGTTFLNATQRGSYDSEGKAAFTLSEFETWLTRFIVEVYHQRIHTSIGVPPVRLFEQAMRDIEPRSPDAHRLRLDLLPLEERSVQRYGLAFDGVHYYSDVLRRWIDSRDPDNPRRKRRFIIRRDPRDLSAVYFFDPELSCYFEIPYRDRSRPAISLWELREAQARLKQQGIAKMDEDLIFQAYRKLRALETNASAATRTARRASSKKPPRKPIPPLSYAVGDPDRDPIENSDEDICPFEEIEPWP